MIDLVANILSAPDVEPSQEEAFLHGLQDGLDFPLDGRLRGDEEAYERGLLLGEALTKRFSPYQDAS